MPVGKTIASTALWLAVLCASSATGGQTPEAPVQTVRISGAVIYGYGAPAQYEAVSLAPAGARDSLMAVPTDQGGKFVFAAVQRGKYVLLVHLP